MKKYHVYGLGNALVDKEFAVDDQFFTHEGIQKGVMTLVDGPSQDKLLERLTSRYELRKRSGGGSAANTLYAISQFGGNTFYSCKVANDELGDFYLSELGNHNINTNQELLREAGTTGRCLVMISPDAERTMLSHLGISEKLCISDLDLDALADAEYLYIEGYLVTSPTGRQACIEARQHARKHGVKVALTLSDPGMVQFFRGGLEEMIGDGVDLLFANDVEALAWTGCETIEEAIESLKSLAATMVITLGADGALLFDGNQLIKVAPHRVQAIDTNGAGDIFAGAFMYAVSTGHDFDTAGRLASLAAATLVEHYGPRLKLEQHEAILQRVMGNQ
jgi:sugar/nucleoside kinase (ribokinase family)